MSSSRNKRNRYGSYETVLKNDKNATHNYIGSITKKTEACGYSYVSGATCESTEEQVCVIPAGSVRGDAPISETQLPDTPAFLRKT
jgi:hypothetical protein